MKPVQVEQEGQWKKSRSLNAAGWFMMTLFGVVVLSLVVPLSVWLTRLALGG